MWHRIPGNVVFMGPCLVPTNTGFMTTETSVHVNSFIGHLVTVCDSSWSRTDLKCQNLSERNDVIDIAN